MSNSIEALVEMTRALGEPAMDYVIIGEGNTSMAVDAESFAVKASGQEMRQISADGFIVVPFAPYLDWLDDPDSHPARSDAARRKASFNRSQLSCHAAARLRGQFHRAYPPHRH